MGQGLFPGGHYFRLPTVNSRFGAVRRRRESNWEESTRRSDAGRRVAERGAKGWVTRGRGAGERAPCWGRARPRPVYVRFAQLRLAEVMTAPRIWPSGLEVEPIDAISGVWYKNDDERPLLTPQLKPLSSAHCSVVSADRPPTRPIQFSSSTLPSTPLYANTMLEYKHLTPEERAHFVEHGWLKIENAIAPQFLHGWMENLWVRLGMDPNDKSTWTEEYVKLPRHREVRCEEFCPQAWAKMCEIVGGEDKIDPVRERYYGDQFIINFGKEELKGGSHKPEDLKGWHTDNDW